MGFRGGCGSVGRVGDLVFGRSLVRKFFFFNFSSTFWRTGLTKVFLREGEYGAAAIDSMRMLM